MMTLDSIKASGYEPLKPYSSGDLVGTYDFPITNRGMTLYAHVYRQTYTKDNHTVYHFWVEAKPMNSSVLEFITFDPYGSALITPTRVIEGFLAKLDGE